MSNMITRSQTLACTTDSYSESLQIGITNIKTLENDIKLLNKQNISLQKQISKLKAKYKSSINNIEPQPSNQNKWLDDEYLNTFIDSLNKEVLKSHSTILFVSPSVTHLIKNGSNYEVLSTLTSLNYDLMSHVFFCLNNLNETTSLKSNDINFGRGSHWSLLVFIREQNVFQHYDSISGLNSNHAKAFCRKVNPDCKFIQMDTLQQSSNFECAIHVLVNARLVLKEILKADMNQFEMDDVSRINNISNRDNPNLQVSNDLYLNTKSCNSSVSIEFHSEETKHSNITEVSFVNSRITSRRNTKLSQHIKDKSTFQLNCQNRFQVLENLEETNIIDLNKYSSKEKSKNQNVKLPTNNKYKPGVNESTHLKSLSSNLNTNLSINSNIAPIKLKPCKDNGNITTITNVGYDKLFCHNKTQSETKQNADDYKKKCILLSDSHGRGLGSTILNTLSDYKVLSHVYPGATLSYLVTKMTEVCSEMTADDLLIFIGGTNDINQTPLDDIKFHIDSIICSEICAKIVFLDIPYRYDKSHYNPLIKRINYYKQTEIMCSENRNYTSLSLQDLTRKNFTRHGLHLNYTGKRKLKNIICSHLVKFEHLYKNTTCISSNVDVPSQKVNHNNDVDSLVDYNFNRIQVIVSNRPFLEELSLSNTDSCQIPRR